ncbi:MAG TPA: DNA polymerase IV [Solirubrobacteraceae bacterium]|nr:DNA polymerase IV [Solirubrobacteraceae bacterium]
MAEFDPGRIVAHLDMDAFYVSVELRRHPELRGRPVVVAGSGPRAVVTTASYEARRFGVGSAIPAALARRLCPQAIVLPPDFPYYRAASAEVMAIIRRHVEVVEVVGLDEVYLELTGLPAPRACMRRIVTEIQGNTGLTASVGIGPNKLVAKVASDAEKPAGFVVLSRQQACERFAGASCRLIPGIGGRTVERLASLGVRTVAELAQAPLETLGAAFSARTALHLMALARFEHHGAVSEERKIVSESRERTFDQDVRTLPELESILERLVQELCVALERQGRRGRTVGIKVRLDDFTTHTRARTLAVGVNRSGDVGRVALELLRAFDPPRPVRLLGVRVAGLSAQEHSSEQLTLSV